MVSRADSIMRAMPCRMVSVCSDEAEITAEPGHGGWTHDAMPALKLTVREEHDYIYDTCHFVHASHSMAPC